MSVKMGTNKGAPQRVFRRLPCLGIDVCTRALLCAAMDWIRGIEGRRKVREVEGTTALEE